jgi:cell division septation protein DedD
MINNERGGIIGRLFIVLAGFALMMGFFSLGYYVGRYHSSSEAPGDNMPPLPDVVSKNLPKPEEFTFYKTLTDKENRTVSINLKPKSMNTFSAPETKQSLDAPKPGIQEVAKDSVKRPKPEEKITSTETEKKNVAKPAHEAEKKIASLKQATSTKLRYTIQVSSYLERQAAEEDVRRMKQNGFAAFIVSSELQGKGTWYRVRIGRFTNRDAAEKLQKEIHAKVGMESIVVLE